MRKKNVYLIDIGTGNNMNLLPLSIGAIGSYCMSVPELAKAYNFHFSYLRGDLWKKVNELDDPEVVGIACYVWNFRGSLQLASFIKERFPSTTVVLGGYSVPNRPERIKIIFQKHLYIDILVHGEGELTFADILFNNLEIGELNQVKGISYRTNDIIHGFISTDDRARINDLNVLPSPFLNGVFDSLLDRYGNSITGALWETNRGCPYSCTFCDWGDSNFNKIKTYDSNRLSEEINWIGKQGFYYLALTDANFGIFVERDQEIAEMIIRSKEKHGAPRHLMTNWAKNKNREVLRIAEQVNAADIFCNITFSNQSYNPETLNAIKRRNIKVTEAANVKTEYHDRNIWTMNEIILGLPMETYESFLEGLNLALSPSLKNLILVYTCHLLENSELSTDDTRKKYNIETRTCRHSVPNREYEAMDAPELEELVVGTSTLPTEKWGRAYVMGHLVSVFYNFRLAFFIMNFLKQENGTVYTDYVEFIYDEVKSHPESYSCINRGIHHIENQRQMILDGICSMSGMPGLEDHIMWPQSAATAILLTNIDELYSELHEITLKFKSSLGLKFNDDALEDVIKFQKCAMPSWPLISPDRVRFSWNIPEYFQELMDGLSTVQLKNEPTLVHFNDFETPPANYKEFATTVVVGGMRLFPRDYEIVPAFSSSKFNNENVAKDACDLV